MYCRLRPLHPYGCQWRPVDVALCLMTCQATSSYKKHWTKAFRNIVTEFVLHQSEKRKTSFGKWGSERLSHCARLRSGWRHKSRRTATRSQLETSTVAGNCTVCLRQVFQFCAFETFEKSIMYCQLTVQLSVTFQCVVLRQYVISSAL